MKYLILHSKFLNKDFSLDIIRKSIKILTVILKSTMEGNVSHFFDVGLCSVFMLCRRKSQYYFSYFFTLHMIKK